MNPECVRALELRQQLSKSSVKKVMSIVNRVADDGRVRHNYKFYGAHTGRWSGEGVQLQNLPRGTVKNVDEAVACINSSADVESIRGFGKPLDVVSSCLRGAFQAPEGMKYVVADLSSIETRVLAWLAKCQPLIDVFAQGLDPYLDFGAFWFGKPYDEVTKGERQLAKPAVLGCGYMLSGGDWRMDCCGRLRDETRAIEMNMEYCTCKKKGDEFKSGLWGYAENMRTELTYEQAHQAVAAYREKYREVVQFWYRIEDAFIDCVLDGRERSAFGLTIGVVPGKVLWVALPSGRRLHYLNPQLKEGKFRKPALTHYSYDSTRGWCREQLYGGLITENLVQAIARDVLAEGMLRADGMGFTIVGHTHDEIICVEREETFRVAPRDAMLDGLVMNMTQPMPWAPDLQLKAEGYESKVYKK
jgi:DNA polymerase bacteriophage-type